MPNNEHQRILAEVSPRSIGGVSLFETTSTITVENVNQFHSETEDIASTSRELCCLGFEVLQEGPVTISIAGSRRLFEEVFGAQFTTQQTTVMEGRAVEFLASAAPLQAVGELANLIEGIAITYPPTYFGPPSPLPPLAQANPQAYRYLFVPDEVGLILNANRVHRIGATGKGIKVAIIDTGFYQHPFFNWHGYNASVILGPGATNPEKDDLGHGTFVAANMFAVAPNAELILIKDAGNPVGCCMKAVNAKPKVLICPFGYNIDSMTWSQLKAADPGMYSYLKALEAAIAQTVTNGITVCVAGGTGARSFPGSHPDVISVGGVHPNDQFLSFDDLEASTYASSFDSKLYPGRHVPDVCGLVGKRVTTSPAAPLVMSLVQPGCSFDLPNTGSTNDGWSIVSGTGSTACAHAGGVAALMLEKKPNLTPAQVKERLMKSAIDIKKGSSAMGDTAGPGVDAATGAGLVNAKWAWLMVATDVAVEFFASPPDQRAQMLDRGQMPRDVSHYVEELIDILRSH
jgi:subtilisin family serine protease